MTRRWRKALLPLALLATLLAAWFAPAPEGFDAVQPVERKATPRQSALPSEGATLLPAASAAAARVLVLRPRDDADEALAQGLFAARTWQPAAPPAAPPVAPAPAPPPAAPPAAPAPPALPFRVLGRYSDATGAGVFLQFNDQNLVARVGDTLVGQYKVESISATTLTLRYLPMNLTQTLEVGTGV